MRYGKIWLPRNGPPIGSRKTSLKSVRALDLCPLLGDSDCRPQPIGPANYHSAVIIPWRNCLLYSVPSAARPVARHSAHSRDNPPSSHLLNATNDRNQPVGRATGASVVAREAATTERGPPLTSAQCGHDGAWPSTDQRPMRPRRSVALHLTDNTVAPIRTPGRASLGWRDALRSRPLWLGRRPRRSVALH